MDFGRQPQPVKVTISGEALDVEYWFRHFQRAAEFKGDSTQVTVDEHGAPKAFTIYPRAVNE